MGSVTRYDHSKSKDIRVQFDIKSNTCPVYQVMLNKNTLNSYHAEWCIDNLDEHVIRCELVKIIPYYAIDYVDELNHNCNHHHNYSIYYFETLASSMMFALRFSEDIGTPPAYNAMYEIPGSDEVRYE